MGTDQTLIEYRLVQLEDGVAALRQANRTRNAREARAILAGLGLLGSVLFAVLSVLWSYRSVITK